MYAQVSALSAFLHMRVIISSLCKYCKKQPLFSSGQSKPEFGTQAFSALDSHSPSMAFDECLTDVEAKSQSHLRIILYRDTWFSVIALPDALLGLNR